MEVLETFHQFNSFNSFLAQSRLNLSFRAQIQINLRYNQRSDFYSCVFSLSYLDHQESGPPTQHRPRVCLRHQPPNTWLKSSENVSVWCWWLQRPWEGTREDAVCNFTGGAGEGWECHFWSWRFNLRQLALVYSPTDCKHNGSLWYRADCRFIRARGRVSGEQLYLSLFDELVYFPCTLEAQNKLIGKQSVYQKLKNAFPMIPDSQCYTKATAKSLIRAFWK